MGDPRWHSTVRESQASLLDKEAKPRGLTRSEVFLVALTRGIDALRTERLLGKREAHDRPTSEQEPKAEKPSLKNPKAAKPDADKQIEASEITLLDDEPVPSKPKLSAIDQSFVDLKETPKILKVAAAEDMDDLLDQVLSDGPAEASRGPSEAVSEPWRPTYANPKDAEPVANPFADAGED